MAFIFDESYSKLFQQLCASFFSSPRLPLLVNFNELDDSFDDCLGNLEILPSSFICTLNNAVTTPAINDNEFNVYRND